MGLPNAPSHGCDALIQIVTFTALLSPTSPWGTVCAVQGTMDPGVWRVLPLLLRLWSVLNVVMPEQTNALGVRAVERFLGDRLSPMHVAKLGVRSVSVTP
jgi:hypothetical protein